MLADYFFICVFPILVLGGLGEEQMNTSVDKHNEELERLQKIFDSAECQIYSDSVPEGPYQRAIDEGKTAEHAYIVWHDYYAKLPLKCFPSPFLTPYKYKTLPEAIREWAAFPGDPESGNPYFKAIQRGENPGQAYLTWVHSSLIEPISA